MPERISADDMVRKIYEARVACDSDWTLYVEWPDEPVLRIQKKGEPDSHEYVGPDPAQAKFGAEQDYRAYMDYLQELDHVTAPAPLLWMPRYLLEEIMGIRREDDLSEDGERQTPVAEVLAQRDTENVVALSPVQPQAQTASSPASPANVKGSYWTAKP